MTHLLFPHFLRQKRNTKKGFTLIELLVVIAIIGILATIVLASLQNARRKSRDVRRIADLKQIQLGLELYADSQPSFAYPTTAQGTAVLVTGGFMTTVPTNPTGGAYSYAGCVPATSYVIGATLEDTAHPAFSSDLDGTVCTIACADPVYCVQP